jgi:LysM repeat protein
MFICLLMGCVLAAAAQAQTNPAQFELANLREDVRGLVQRVGELGLRVEQLERENSELRRKASAADGRAFVTVAQLNEAVADLNRNLKTAVAGSKTETLQVVAAQMEKLAKQTNAALDALAKTPAPAPAARPTATVTFTEEYPKEGASYVVQKGDTLAVIAKKTGAKQQDIVNANKISDPSLIKIGQTIFIPGAK